MKSSEVIIEEIQNNPACVRTVIRSRSRAFQSASLEETLLLHFPFFRQLINVCILYTIFVYACEHWVHCYTRFTIVRSINVIGVISINPGGKKIEKTTHLQFLLLCLSAFWRRSKLNNNRLASSDGQQ